MMWTLALICTVITSICALLMSCMLMQPILTKSFFCYDLFFIYSFSYYVFVYSCILIFFITLCIVLSLTVKRLLLMKKTKYHLKKIDT